MLVLRVISKRTALKITTKSANKSFLVMMQWVNDAVGPQLPTYAVSVKKHIFGSDRLLVFMFYRPIKWHWHLNLHSTDFLR